MDARETIERARASEVEHCREHLMYYADTYAHIEDKDAPDVVVPLRMWPMQREAMEAILDNRLNIILKARQLGVTWLALVYASWVMLRPGRLVIALSRTEDEAKELVRRLGVVFRAVPELGLTVRQTALELSVQWPDGDSVFKAFPSSSGAGRSFTANLLLLDEWAFQQWAESIWLSVYPTINRPTGGQVIGLSTIERGTLFERLYTEDGNGFHKIFLPWFADPRRDAAWYEATKQALGDLVMQEYPATVEEALTIPGGAYFPEFQHHIHVVPSESVHGVSRYVSLDYGLDMFAVVFWEVDRQGHARGYRQIYQSDLIVSDAAKLLLEVQGEDKIEAYYAPPDLWNRNRDTGESTAEVFYKHGVPLTRVSNDLEMGCMMVKEYLKPITVRNEQTGEEHTTSAMTFAAGACLDAVRCLTKIQRDKNRPNIYAKTPHNLTHMVDAIRYFVAGRPRAGQREEPERYGYMSQLKELMGYE